MDHGPTPTPHPAHGTRPPPFGPAEFAARRARAAAWMDQERLDALLLTAEVNFRYFSGFDSPTWTSPTRPLYLVVPRHGPPHAIIPDGAVSAMRATADIDRISRWPAPVPADDGLSLVAEALRDLRGEHGRVGAELGFEQHLRMPVQDFLRLGRMLAPIALVDGSPVIRACRMVKSPGEVARIGFAAHVLSGVLAELPGHVRPGMSEREACLWLHMELLRRGVDRLGYVAAASGPDGYAAINMHPGACALREGDVFIIDAGAVVDGYHCDFDRNYAVGRPPSDAVRRLDDQLHAATEAGIAACVPGARCADVWRAMAAVLGEARVREAGVGRMGHAIGLHLTEQPSIHPDDTTVLEPGMVLTVEPSAGHTGADGRALLLVHEENLVVTEGGARLLSARARPGFMRID